MLNKNKALLHGCQQCKYTHNWKYVGVFFSFSYIVETWVIIQFIVHVLTFMGNNSSMFKDVESNQN